jgi:ubiquinone/menaquinone biosynthesis C-methylase UbiE
MSVAHNQTITPEKKQEGQMGSWARYYDLIMFFLTLGREKKLRQITLDLAQIKPGDKILEIGCGTGTLTLAIKERVGTTGEAKGIDIAPEMAEIATCKAARKGADVNIQVGSIEKIPFPENRFDKVLCSFMIFHMPEEVRLKGLKEIYRVLKSGGRLFILDGESKDKRYDLRELAPILKSDSFTDPEIGSIKFAVLKGVYLRATVKK